MNPNTRIRFRQVHLDFHTSEHCPNVGGEFDEGQFITSLRVGHVDSVTVFAQCHHGWCYYPTKTDCAHPNLQTDLLGRMLVAGKEANINMPVYITVQWNEKAAREHPEWRIRRPDGTYMGRPERHPHSALPIGGWHRLCTNSPYLDNCLLPVLREVMATYRPSGIFLDITGEFECTCSWCLESMRAMGLDVENPGDRMRHADKVYKDYLKKTTEIIWGTEPETTVYHNSSEKKGRYDLYPYWSHYEIESLPTGGWGYHHFPPSARYFTQLPGCQILGMTGKFHRSWGEFGGFKNPVALRYEVAQIGSLGCRCSVGDQLHPGGKMDTETYRIIGEAYSWVEACEAWLEDAEPVAEVAVLAPSAVHQDPRLEESEIGAGSVLMENQIPHVLIDATMDFAPYRLLILPDCVRVNDDLQEKLEAHLSSGGSLLLSGESGLDHERSGFALDVGARYMGNSRNDVEYIVAGESIARDLVRSPFLIYEAGITLEPDGCEVLADIWKPYFNRTYEHFCSHRNTPFEGPSGSPAVVRKGRVIHFAHPIFRNYAREGMQLHRDLVRNAVDLLYDDPLIDIDLPSCGRVSLMRQPGRGNRLVLHLIYANPIKRGNTEVIEDVVPLYDVCVSVKARDITKVYLAPGGEELPFEASNGRIACTLPKLELNQIVVLE